ncbi:uncharacterized protein LOC121880377 isoform X2 [Homarus americanus]|uniref:uncharacterized protein LOC121880377 isoform X2 n=1 Tax=Homarus americanus TaxID=6706 RepID=UPI001C496A48|nr:uncharacterized protein LOC121880377 isoform X2 [Homarus americanus]
MQSVAAVVVTVLGYTVAAIHPPRTSDDGGDSPDHLPFAHGNATLTDQTHPRIEVPRLHLEDVYPSNTTETTVRGHQAQPQNYGFVDRSFTSVEEGSVSLVDGDKPTQPLSYDRMDHKIFTMEERKSITPGQGRSGRRIHDGEQLHQLYHRVKHLSDSLSDHRLYYNLLSHRAFHMLLNEVNKLPKDAPATYVTPNLTEAVQTLHYQLSLAEHIVHNLTFIIREAVPQYYVDDYVVTGMINALLPTSHTVLKLYKPSDQYFFSTSDIHEPTNQNMPSTSDFHMPINKKFPFDGFSAPSIHLPAQYLVGDTPHPYHYVMPDTTADAPQDMLQTYTETKASPPYQQPLDQDSLVLQSPSLVHAQPVGVGDAEGPGTLTGPGILFVTDEVLRPQVHETVPDNITYSPITHDNTTEKTSGKNHALSYDGQFGDGRNVKRLQPFPLSRNKPKVIIETAPHGGQRVVSESGSIFSPGGRPAPGVTSTTLTSFIAAMNVTNHFSRSIQLSVATQHSLTNATASLRSSSAQEELIYIKNRSQLSVKERMLLHHQPRSPQRSQPITEKHQDIIEVQNDFSLSNLEGGVTLEDPLMTTQPPLPPSPTTNIFPSFTVISTPTSLPSSVTGLTSSTVPSSQSTTLMLKVTEDESYVWSSSSNPGVTSHHNQSSLLPLLRPLTSITHPVLLTRVTPSPPGHDDAFGVHTKPLINASDTKLPHVATLAAGASLWGSGQKIGQMHRSVTTGTLDNTTTSPQGNHPHLLHFLKYWMYPPQVHSEATVPNTELVKDYNLAFSYVTLPPPMPKSLSVPHSLMRRPQPEENHPLPAAPQWQQTPVSRLTNVHNNIIFDIHSQPSASIDTSDVNYHNINIDNSIAVDGQEEQGIEVYTVEDQAEPISSPPPPTNQMSTYPPKTHVPTHPATTYVPTYPSTNNTYTHPTTSSSLHSLTLHLNLYAPSTPAQDSTESYVNKLVDDNFYDYPENQNKRRRTPRMDDGRKKIDISLDKFNNGELEGEAREGLGNSVSGRPILRLPPLAPTLRPGATPQRHPPPDRPLPPFPPRARPGVFSDFPRRPGTPAPPSPVAIDPVSLLMSQGGTAVPFITTTAAPEPSRQQIYNALALVAGLHGSFNYGESSEQPTPVISLHTTQTLGGELQVSESQQTPGQIKQPGTTISGAVSPPAPPPPLGPLSILTNPYPVPVSQPNVGYPGYIGYPGRPSYPYAQYPQYPPFPPPYSYPYPPPSQECQGGGASTSTSTGPGSAAAAAAAGGGCGGGGGSSSTSTAVNQSAGAVPGSASVGGGGSQVHLVSAPSPPSASPPAPPPLLDKGSSVNSPAAPQDEYGRVVAALNTLMAYLSRNRDQPAVTTSAPSSFSVSVDVYVPILSEILGGRRTTTPIPAADDTHRPAVPQQTQTPAHVGLQSQDIQSLIEMGYTYGG